MEVPASNPARRTVAISLVILAVFVGASCLYSQTAQPSPAGSTTASPSDPAPPAASALKVDSGDTAWLLISAALVLLMTPALAFFYGGLVRKKNILSVLMQCMMILCIISLQWAFFGYSLAFSGNWHGLIGDLK